MKKSGNTFDVDTIFKADGAFEHVFGASKAKLIPANKVAMEKGAEAARKCM